MLLSEGFLLVLIDANQIFPKIVGTLYTYNSGRTAVETIKNLRTRNGFMARWILLMLILVSMITQFVMLKAQSYKDDKLMEVIFSILMITFTLVLTERYRIKTMFPEELTTFLNAAISFENTYVKGKQISKINST